MRLYNLVARIWAGLPGPLRQIYIWLSGNHSPSSILLPDRYEIVEIQGGISKGMKMRLNLRRERSYFFGTHEWEVQSVLAAVVRSGMTVYNIGAHIGFFTLGLHLIAGSTGQVVAFEPNPKVRERLFGHLSLNGIGDSVRVEEYALGDFDGKANFSLSLSDSQGRFGDLPYVKSGPVIQVHCKRLDTYVEEGGPIPDFILMDVEHAEGRVLRGMSQVMELHKPLIIIEMHGTVSIEESWKELKEHNYSLLSLPGLRILKSINKITCGHYLAAHMGYFRQGVQ
jgi:FkbM family methyltransferase